MPVTIGNPKRRQIPRCWLSRACTHTLGAYGDTNDDVTVIITNDDQLHELNLQFRGIDRPTDVLSFNLVDSTNPVFPSIPLVDMGNQLGEVYISWQAAQRQAIAAGHSLDHEVVFLAVHGVLHLLGYNDDTEAELLEMMRVGSSILEITQQEEQTAR
ncbi:MAG: rRNA maturation RNase YbeY [Armatimonadota bacterium]